MGNYGYEHNDLKWYSGDGKYIIIIVFFFLSNKKILVSGCLDLYEKNSSAMFGLITNRRYD